MIGHALAPGTYLRVCREAADLTRDELAFAIETIPALPALSRAEWLGQIEAGIAPFQIDVMLALETHPELKLDQDVLLALARREAGLTPHAPAVCRGCAVVDWSPCLPGVASAEGWTVPDRCPACDGGVEA